MERTIYTEREAIQFIRENDVRFIKLFFTDVFGEMKSLSIQPSELERAFSEGISFDASAVPGFLGVAESDLFIVPDPSTLCVLPWRPQSGRVVRFFCSVRRADGSAFEGDTRQLLAAFVEELRGRGLECTVGTECEFYLFKLDANGEPTDEPYDRAGYCDLAPRDKGENVRREICLTLEQMGIHPESSHHETGPGQNEVDFRSSDPLSAADNLQTFKVVVSTIAARNGLYASFSPKPLVSEAGNGLHVNVSVEERGEGLFGGGISGRAGSFIAGVLRRSREIAAFVNPLPPSYRRLGRFEAPMFVSWSRQNRSQLVRIPAERGGRLRMEFRQPDPAANPYLAVLLVLRAGIEGMDEGLPLPAPLDIDLYSASEEQVAGLERLPRGLREAAECAGASGFVRAALPASTVATYCGARRLDELLKPGL